MKETMDENMRKNQEFMLASQKLQASTVWPAGLAIEDKRKFQAWFTPLRGWLYSKF